MTHLEPYVRTGLADLAAEVEIVDLRQRVTDARLRHRRRRRALATVSALAVAASIIAGVAIWRVLPSQPQTIDPAGTALPGVIDLTTARSGVAEEPLRMLVQTRDSSGAAHFFGIDPTLAEVVDLTEAVDLPDLSQEAGDYGVVQMSADGIHVLFYRPGLGEDDVPPTVTDLQTGSTSTVPWSADYQNLGVTPDGQSVLITELPGWQPVTLEAAIPWRVTVMDLATQRTQEVALPADHAVVGSGSRRESRMPMPSPSGASVALTLGSVSGSTESIVMSTDGQFGMELSGAPLSAAPWSPGSDQLLIEGGSASSYRIVHADPAAPDVGSIFIAGATLGRTPLGWANDRELLWFDPASSSVIRTTLEGDQMGAPLLIRAGDDEITAVVLAPVRAG